MLTEICQYLHNWFDRNQAKFYGKFIIKDGEIESFNDGDMGLVTGQYFRIIGSLFNDGVHQYHQEKYAIDNEDNNICDDDGNHIKCFGLNDELKDETFEGAVWSMAIPPAVLTLSKDIVAWQTKYGGADSAAMSPYQSESFGGYSYSKSSGASGSDGGGTWQSMFANRLKSWRKLGG